MIAPKGYVVRGKWSNRDMVARVESLDKALDERAIQSVRGCTDVAVYRIDADGTETKLPSYEEALAMLTGSSAPFVPTEEQACRSALLLALYRKGATERQVIDYLDREVEDHRRTLIRYAENKAIIATVLMPPADPLAALEAAERRLLEAGGWTPDTATKGRWIEPKFKHSYPRRNAVQIERDVRRLAAKGGA